MVQCMACRQELPCPCIEEVTRHRHQYTRPEPRRSMAVPPAPDMPGELDQAAMERLWQAMMREQRGGGD